MISTAALVEGRAVSKTFPIEGGAFRRRSGSVAALKNVSFQINKGETLAVVGGSGCGKSTLAKILVGLLAPDSGTILWQGEPLAGGSRPERARRIQMVFQDPFASLNPKLSIGTQLREILRLASDIPSPLVGEGKDGGKAPSPLPRQTSGESPAVWRPLSPTRGEGDVKQLLETVGLPGEAMLHYPFQFSGGQRQRIAIARAIALKPALLIADEPLSALDVTIQAHILKLFKELKTAYDLTILFISHDLAVVESFADRAIVLQDGEVAEEGPVSRLLSHPRHPYTQALLEAVPKINF